MQIFEKEAVETDVLKSIVCDVCKKKYDMDEYKKDGKNIHSYETQEFICIDTHGGYGSKTIGDCTRVQLDICQYCFRDMFEKFYRLTKPKY